MRCGWFSQRFPSSGGVQELSFMQRSESNKVFLSFFFLKSKKHEGRTSDGRGTLAGIKTDHKQQLPTVEHKMSKRNQSGEICYDFVINK